MSKCELSFSNILAGFYDSQFEHNKGTISPDRKIIYYELEYFPETGGTACINGTSYPIRKGCVLCAAPGSVRHSVLHFKAYYVKCSTENNLLKSLLNQLPVITRFGEEDTELKKLFQQIGRLCERGDSIHLLYAESKLLELIFYLVTKNHTEEQRQVYHPSIRQAILFVDHNYKSDIKLEDIARAVGLTPVYLHNLFLKNTGQTPHNYLMEKRLAVSKELLTGSDMSLVNIAAECGFSSQSYFNAVFKKYCGTTPLKYRQHAFGKYQL